MLFPPAGYVTVPSLFKLNHREKQAVRPQVSEDSMRENAKRKEKKNS